jgi:hypothetical protein
MTLCPKVMPNSEINKAASLLKTKSRDNPRSKTKAVIILKKASYKKTWFR